MKKRVLLVMMIVCMMLSAVACNKKTEIENKTKAKADVVGGKTEEKTQTIQKPNENNNLIDVNYVNLPESKGFEFVSNGDGTCVLNKIGECTDKDIVIPQKSPEGDTVIAIAKEAFYDSKDVKSVVVINKNLTIKENAFSSGNVDKVVIISSNIEIEEGAFEYSDDISEVYISNSSIQMGKYAFYESGNNMEVKLLNCKGNIGKNVFDSSDISKLHVEGSKLEFGDSSFEYCEDLAMIEVKNSELKICEYAFCESGNKATATFKNCVLEIEESAFEFGSILSLDISGDNLIIQDSAFDYCEDLTSVNIASNNTEIGEYAFSECEVLKSVIIGQGKIKLGDNAFAFCDKLESVEIKGDIETLGEDVFYDCPKELVIRYNDVAYNQENIEKIK